MFVIFENYPFWLSVLSPLSFGRLIFINYKSEHEVKNQSELSNLCYEKHTNAWPRDKVMFRHKDMDPPSFFLNLGTFSFLDKHR